MLCSSLCNILALVLALLKVKESEGSCGLGGFNGTAVENIQSHIYETPQKEHSKAGGFSPWSPPGAGLHGVLVLLQGWYLHVHSMSHILTLNPKGFQLLWEVSQEKPRPFFNLLPV